MEIGDRVLHVGPVARGERYGNVTHVVRGWGASVLFDGSPHPVLCRGKNLEVVASTAPAVEEASEVEYLEAA